MTPPPPPTELPSPSFHALILADLGLASSAEADAATSEGRTDETGGRGGTGPFMVDRDDLEEVLASVGPRIGLTPGPDLPALDIPLRSLDDLHPDALLARLPLFHALERLVAEGQREGRGGEDEGESEGRGGARAEAGGGLLDQVLAQTPGPDSGNGIARPVPTPSGTPGDMADFLRRITLPHQVAEPGQREMDRREMLDRMRVNHLRAILHHSRFQAVEGVWRGLEFLVRRLDTGPDLKIWVAHLPGSRAKAMARGGELGTFLDRARSVAGLDAAWSAVLVHDAFGATAPDLEALAGMAGVGRERETAFLAEVTPGLLAVAEDPELLARWEALRSHPGAGWMGLLLPRFLLRAPYGAEENPCERLDFEELEPGEGPDPGMLLWGHPGLAALLLLGRTFRARHSDLPRPVPTGVDGLSPILHRGAGGSALVPPAELMLGGAEVEELAEVGLIPVVARAGDPTLRFPTVPSVAASGERLRVRGL